jgi:hypothetical protein
MSPGMGDSTRVLFELPHVIMKDDANRALTRDSHSIRQGSPGAWPV